MTSGAAASVVLAATAVSVPAVWAGGHWLGVGGRFGGVGDVAAFDAEGFSVDEGVGDFFMRGVDDAAEGLARDVHAVGGVLLVQAFVVGQTHGFEFVVGEDDFFERGQGDALRLKEAAARHPADLTIVLWSWHF